MSHESRYGYRLLFAALIVTGVLLITPVAAHAAMDIATEAMQKLFNSIDSAQAGWLTKAQQICLQLLATTAVIGFAIGLKDLVVAGQLSLENIVALMVRFAFIVGILVWLLDPSSQGGANGTQFLRKIPESIKEIGVAISGTSVKFDEILILYGDLVAPIRDAMSKLGFRDTFLWLGMLLIVFFINCVFFMIAATILVVEIETIFIFVGGMFTAPFFVIGYFKDVFMGYVKGLISAGVKLLLMCLLLGLMKQIMGQWPALLAPFVANKPTEGTLTVLMSMSTALLIFYMVLQAVPQYASAIMTGSPTAGGGGMFTGAVAAGMGTAMTVVNASKTAAKSAYNTGMTVKEAAEAYKYGKDNAAAGGATLGESRAAGFNEAVKSAMTGEIGASQRRDRGRPAAKYADVVASMSGGNSMEAGSKSSSGSSAKTAGKNSSAAKSGTTLSKG